MPVETAYSEDQRSEQDSLMQSVVAHQKIMFQSMQGQEMPEWLGSEMTMPQFKIIFLLYTHGPLRMGDIAATLNKNISTATGVVDRLVDQYLIKREEDPDDRRVVIVRLTERGTQVCESFLQAGWQHARNMLERLTLEELRVVEKGMQLMARVAMEDAQERIGKSSKP